MNPAAAVMIPSISPAAPAVNNSGPFHSNSGRGGSVRNTYHYIITACTVRYTLVFLLSRIGFDSWTVSIFALIVCQSLLSLTPVIDHGFLEAGVLHHTGDLLSSFGSVLQLRVNLMVPVSVSHLLSGGHVRSHHCTVPQPGHFDFLRVEVVRTAHQQRWMSAVALLH